MTLPSAAFIRSDIRFSIAQSCLQALFPGAVLVAKYDPVDLAHSRVHGALPPAAEPLSIELSFMPPPGLSFDSRHPGHGIMRLRGVVDDACAQVLAGLDAEEADALPPALRTDPDIDMG